MATVREQRGPLFPGPRVKTVSFRRFASASQPHVTRQLFIIIIGGKLTLNLREKIERLTRNAAR